MTLCGKLFQNTLEQLDQQQREMVKQVKMDIEEMENGRQRLVEQFDKVCVSPEIVTAIKIPDG